MHLAGSDKKGFKTDWGPVGFKKSRHPLSIMVRCEATSSFSCLFTSLVSRSLFLFPSFPLPVLSFSLPPFFLHPSLPPSKVESQRIDLLKHPLVTSLLNYKWKTYGRYFYFGNLLIYIIFLLFLTAFALTVINPLEPICKHLDSSMSLLHSLIPRPVLGTRLRLFYTRLYFTECTHEVK